jgi:hypothetical protein
MEDATDVRGPLADLIAVNPFSDRLEAGSGSAFLVLASFLVAFLAIRTSTRLARSVSWWPSGIETKGGLHVHHLVFGIFLMLLCGFVAFAAPLEPPWWHLTAIGFGVGAGLTLDEFPLWLRLSDVYWSAEGRPAFDAVVCSCTFAALVVIGVRPFGLDETSSIVGTAVVVAVVLGLALVCFAKDRILLGVAGLFIPVVALVGAVRLARPGSPWAKWRYDAERLARARARFADSRMMERADRRLGNLVIGAPSRPDPVPPADERRD